MVSGDPNQDGNDTNDRLPGAARNAFTGPDYATTDLRMTRRFFLGQHLKMELIAESFNLLNRDNKTVNITDEGLQTNTASFIKETTELGITYYPGHYQVPANLLRANSAFAPRQVQLGMRLVY